MKTSLVLRDNFHDIWTLFTWGVFITHAIWWGKGMQNTEVAAVTALSVLTETCLLFEKIPQRPSVLIPPLLGGKKAQEPGAGQVDLGVPGREKARLEHQLEHQPMHTAAAGPLLSPAPPSLPPLRPWKSLVNSETPRGRAEPSPGAGSAFSNCHLTLHRCDEQNFNTQFE